MRSLMLFTVSVLYITIMAILRTEWGIDSDEMWLSLRWALVGAASVTLVIRWCEWYSDRLDGRDDEGLAQDDNP